MLHLGVVVVAPMREEKDESPARNNITDGKLKTKKADICYSVYRVAMRRTTEDNTGDG